MKTCRYCPNIKSPDDPKWFGLKCRECYNALARKRQALARQTGETLRQREQAYQFRRKYGITPEQYDVLLHQQDRVCAICKRPETRTEAVEFRLAVDHCHKTDKVRGLLCGECNRAIGFMRDDPERLRNAATYLESHETGG